MAPPPTSVKAKRKRGNVIRNGTKIAKKGQNWCSKYAKKARTFRKPQKCPYNKPRVYYLGGLWEAPGGGGWTPSQRGGGLDRPTTSKLKLAGKNFRQRNPSARQNSPPKQTPSALHGDPKVTFAIFRRALKAPTGPKKTPTQIWHIFGRVLHREKFSLFWNMSRGGCGVDTPQHLQGGVQTIHHRPPPQALRPPPTIYFETDRLPYIPGRTRLLFDQPEEGGALPRN